ncbi:MAG: sensor histidine kinase [Candidatus Thorarchaeota archaeon]
MGHLLKEQSENNDSSSELEQKALYFTLSQYLLEDMVSSNDPMVFLGSVLIKLKELFGGVPSIGIKRSPGIWDCLVLDRAIKAANWTPCVASKSMIFENMSELEYISYSDTSSKVTQCPESVLEIIKSSGVNNIVIVPIKHIEGMILEITNLPVPEKIPQYVTGLEGFMIPLILSLKQVLLLDESMILENESKLLSHILVHDIRNYLSALEGAKYLLTHEKNLDPDTNAALSLAHSSLEGAKMLIQRVGKALTASVSTELSDLNLRHVIDQCLDQLISQRTGVQLDMNIHGSVNPVSPIVLADDLLPEIFLNLFNNAIDNTKQDDKWIQIDWSPWISNPSFLHIRIHDRGSGVPDSVIQNISGRYRQKSAKGLGLGLSIVTRLVQRYNGSFWFEKRMENDVIEGSTANIVLVLSE